MTKQLRKLFNKTFKKKEELLGDDGIYDYLYHSFFLAPEKP